MTAVRTAQALRNGATTAHRSRPATGDVEVVLTGAAGAEAVRQLVLGGVGQDRLPAAVRKCLPARAAGSSQLVKTSFKPGRRLTAYYRLSVTGDRAGSRCAAVTWSARERSGDGAPAARAAADPGPGRELEDEASRRGLVQPFLRLVGTDGPQQSCVRISPFDADFPQLVRLSDRRHLARALGAVGLPAERSQVTALRYRPGQRHVLLLQAVDGRGTALYAKLHRAGQPPDGELLAPVAEHLSRAQPPVALVRPAVALVDDDALVWRTAPGSPLSDLLIGGELGCVAAAGAALRVLHEVPAAALSQLPTYELARELRTIRSASAHLAGLWPEVAARGAAVLAAVDERVGRHAAEDPTLIHGDVKAEHIVVDGGATSWLDLDRCALGDAALDLGKLLADLRWRLGRDSPSRVRPAQDALLAGYGAQTAERWERARLYECLFLVRFAARRVGLHEVGWRAGVETLMTAAEHLLDSVDRQVR